MKHRRWQSIVLAGGVGAAAFGSSVSAFATIPDNLRKVTFSESIFTADPARDQDADGIKDDFEHRLADQWRPLFIFDEQENNGVNTPEPSLQSWEPRVLFQVRPNGFIGPLGSTRRLTVTYVILFRMDGGYRGSNWCYNHHSGDALNFTYNLVSTGGSTWKLDTVVGFDDAGELAANDASLTYSNSALIIYMSAGKHHKYVSGSACENHSGFCDDDCGGGVHRFTDLAPLGYPLNVGEPELHPMGSSINQPFVNELWHIGYPSEWTWFAAWGRDDCVDHTPSGHVFTGGMNSAPGNTGAWVSSSQGNTCVTPVYALFNRNAFWF